MEHRNGQAGKGARCIRRFNLADYPAHESRFRHCRCRGTPAFFCFFGTRADNPEAFAAAGFTARCTPFFPTDVFPHRSGVASGQSSASCLRHFRQL